MIQKKRKFDVFTRKNREEWILLFVSPAMLVTLSTTPRQPLLGYSDPYELSARSTRLNPPPTGTKTFSPVLKYLGIPFGTAARLAPSVAYVAPSDAQRECFEFGPNPMQPLRGAVEKFWIDKAGWRSREHVGMSEDCLSLNVFIPEAAAKDAKLRGELLPVFVWIYGELYVAGVWIKC